MSNDDRFLSDDGEIGHLAEDVGLTDQQFREAADVDDRQQGDPASGPTVAPPD